MAPSTHEGTKIRGLDLGLLRLELHFSVFMCLPFSDAPLKGSPTVQTQVFLEELMLGSGVVGP